MQSGKEVCWTSTAGGWIGRIREEKGGADQAAQSDGAAVSTPALGEQEQKHIDNRHKVGRKQQM